MTYKPVEDGLDEVISFKNEDTASDQDTTYGYDENFTAKLGGNYTKIIEFYSDRL